MILCSQKYQFRGDNVDSMPSLPIDLLQESTRQQKYTQLSALPPIKPKCIQNISAAIYTRKANIFLNYIHCLANIIDFSILIQFIFLSQNAATIFTYYTYTCNITDIYCNCQVPSYQLNLVDFKNIAHSTKSIPVHIMITNQL